MNNDAPLGRATLAFEFVEKVTFEVPNIERDLSAFSESHYRDKHGLIVEIAAIHAGLTENFNHYSPEELEDSIQTWVLPYPKPIILNHDKTSEPVGRVMAAKMDAEEDGSPYVRLQAAITDPQAIAKVTDQRYLTGSVGGKATEALCSVCEADWANASLGNIPCNHRRGKAYKGKLAYMELGGIKWKEYSWVNMPADERSGVRSMAKAEESEDEDGWVRPARVFSLNMDEEEILEFTESANRDILDGVRKKEATPVYMQLKGAFLSAMAADSIAEKQDSAGVKKKGPYGKVRYADPGYQDDDKPRYPLDTEKHVRAAWSYINQKKNQKPYTPEQIKKIKSRIKQAAKKLGIDISDEEFDVTTDTFTEKEEDILAVAESLSSDLADMAADEAEENEADEAAEEAEEEESEETAEESDPLEEDQEDEDEDVAEGDETPEGQESKHDKDVDPEDSDGAPKSRESEDEPEEEAGDEGAEEEESSVDEPEESSDAELGEQLETLKLRVEELEADKERILGENAKLKNLLKQTMAERVVDTKMSLGLIPEDERAEQVEEHMKRSASSLADSMRDLVSLSPHVAEFQPEKLPKVEEEAGAVEDEGAVTEGDPDGGEEKEIAEQLDPEDILVDVLMGRRKM